MALNTATFDKDGKEISLEISFGYAQVGAYALYLWDATGSKKVKIGEGMNTDNKPDVFVLEKPLPQYNGNIVDCIMDILAPNPGEGEKYSATLSVKQGDNEIGHEYDEGNLDSKTVRVRLAVKLICS